MSRTLFIVAAFAGILVSISAQAGSLKMSKDGPTVDELRAVRNDIGDFLRTLHGVNGTGITACDVATGLPFYDLSSSEKDATEFVNCLAVNVDNQASKDAFDILLPSGTKFKGAYISVRNIGKIVVQ